METKEKLVQGSLDAALEKINGLRTPTGLSMEKPDKTDSDLRREIQAAQFDKEKPRTTVVLKNFVDQSEGMREVNLRGSIRSRSKR